MTTYTNGDFSFMTDKMYRSMVQDTYNAVTKTDGGWEFMETFEPDPSRGFMFSSNPMLGNIAKNMELHEHHSGSSYAWSMRQVQYIAKNGWSGYVDLWLSKKEEE